jgi:hypothetical protein
MEMLSSPEWVGSLLHTSNNSSFQSSRWHMQLSLIIELLKEKDYYQRVLFIEDSGGNAQILSFLKGESIIRKMNLKNPLKYLQSSYFCSQTSKLYQKQPYKIYQIFKTSQIETKNKNKIISKHGWRNLPSGIDDSWVIWHSRHPRNEGNHYLTLKNLKKEENKNTTTRTRRKKNKRKSRE